MVPVYPKIKIFATDPGTRTVIDVEREHNDWMAAKAGKIGILAHEVRSEVHQKDGSIKLCIVVTYADVPQIMDLGAVPPDDDDDDGRGGDKPS